jgi:hypothetical protein
MRLADELSKEMASRGEKVRVVDRSLLHHSLINALAPLKSVDEQLARSIAHELNATFMVLGTTTKTEDDVVQLSARLLDTANVADKDWSGTGAVINFHAPKSVADLSPLDPFSFRRLQQVPVGRMDIGPKSTECRCQSASTCRIRHFPKRLESLS